MPSRAGYFRVQAAGIWKLYRHDTEQIRPLNWVERHRLQQTLIAATAAGRLGSHNPRTSGDGHDGDCPRSPARNGTGAPGYLAGSEGTDIFLSLDQDCIKENLLWVWAPNGGLLDLTTLRSFVSVFGLETDSHSARNPGAPHLQWAIRFNWDGDLATLPSPPVPAPCPTLIIWHYTCNIEDARGVKERAASYTLSEPVGIAVHEVRTSTRTPE